MLESGSLVAPTANDAAVVRTYTVADPSGTRLDDELVFQIDVVAVGTAILERFPDFQGSVPLTPYSAWTGWHDCDHDGDLDLVYLLNATLPDGSRQIWFENIGYEKPAPPLPADINGDGRVNGADLGLVLAAWGATR